MAEENTTEQEKKGSKTLLFVIIGAVVLLVLIGVIAIILLSGDKKSETQNQDVAPTQQKANAYSTKETSLLNIGPLYPIDKPFVVNLITQNGRRYLKTSISLELSNPKLQQEVNNKSTIMKDVIIDVLSSKSIEEIITTKGKERIKDEILKRVNQILMDGHIKNIFFTEFVVQ